jgi:ABC-type dipeptide/oligopeptide/nickel transport system permease subunit
METDLPGDAAIIAEIAAEKGAPPSKKIFKACMEHRALAAVSTLALIMAIFIVFAPWVTPYDPNFVNLANRLSPPGITSAHILGTDGFGRDLLARILYGGRLSLGLSLLVVSVNALVGLWVGSAAAYLGGIADSIIMRVVDILMSFPNIILSLFIIGVFGPSVKNLFFALVSLGWIGYARISRSLVLRLKQEAFIQAAKGLGCGGVRLIMNHIVPNVLPTVVIYAAMHIGSTILAIASISFLGLGVQPPSAEWGAMLSDAKQYVSLYPHMIFFPGLAITSSVFIFNIIGDELRDLNDPHIKAVIKT